MKRKSQNIREASDNRNFPIHLENDVLVMNKKHNYYYQVSNKDHYFLVHVCINIMYFLDCFSAIIILILGPGSIANYQNE